MINTEQNLLHSMDINVQHGHQKPMKKWGDLNKEVSHTIMSMVKKY